MNRVATHATQQVVTAGIMRAQQQLAKSLSEQASGKIAENYGALGSATVRNLSAHSLAVRQDGYNQVATQLGTTLSVYDAQMGAMDASVETLRNAILVAIGTGQSVGLQDAFESTFAEIRNSLNTSFDGVALFGGAQTLNSPFKLASFSEMAGIDPAAAFGNDSVKATARIGDGIDLQYGITASEVASPLMAAFRTLAETDTIGATLTPAQSTALNTALSQLGAGQTTMRAVAAVNGRNQSQAETMASRAAERGALLADVIRQSEEADLGQVAIDLAQSKLMLQASYSVFTQLASLSLANYLR